MKNTTFSNGADAVGRKPAVVLLVLLVAGLGACSKAAAPPPELLPPTVLEEHQPTVEELRVEADRRYALGADALRSGDEDGAQQHFDAALNVYMEADIPLGDEAEFRSAFNSLVNRVDAQQLDVYLIPVEASAPELPSEEIPVLSSAEIDMLRARLADTLPALPRFTIPVPADHPRVIEAVKFLSEQRREVIQGGLDRAQRYLPLIHETFADAGVPAELAWIPLIESLFKPVVRSRASAVGLWQLMAPTARLYGLRVDYFVDERRDPVKSTQAISRFILDYYAEFGDWHLAIAAYNGGKGRVGRALQRTNTSDFWSLAATRTLPRETREFVPKILAAILIGTEPERYDFLIEEQPPFEYDEVTIDSMTDLQVIAEAAGTTLETIQELNPQLLRRTTPRIPEYTLRVPAGRARDFNVAYAAIPIEERVRVAEHVVGRGETLSQIGNDYGLSWHAVADYNGIRDPRRVRAGTRLLIPIAQGAASVSVPSSVRPELVQRSGVGRGDKVVHTVRRGESLWLIARAYDTTVIEVKRWNGLRSDRLNQGDTLDVYYGGTTPNVSAGAAPPSTADPGRPSSSGAGGNAASQERTYTVRRGDTLDSIARLHGVALRDLRAWNGLVSSRIYPGDKLTLHTDGSSVSATYTVRRGDTLGRIAQRFGVTVAKLCAWNGIATNTTLFPGNRLVIGDTVSTGQ